MYYLSEITTRTTLRIEDKSLIPASWSAKRAFAFSTEVCFTETSRPNPVWNIGSSALPFLLPPSTI
jgi:hypothetical protein